jgi:hypothetical protein
MISEADCWTKMGCTPIGPPSRSMYMLIELGRLRVLAHHLAWGAGKPVGCSYVAHAIRTLSINHDIWAQALKTGVFGLKSF